MISKARSASRLRNEGREPPLARHVQGVKPEDFTGSPDVFAHRDQLFLDAAPSSLAASAISLSTLARPPRVRSRRQ